MREEKYRRIVNKNTLDCWTVVVAVLIAAYITEIFKGTRDVQYVITFSIITGVPLFIARAAFRKNDATENMKYLFIVGVISMYTFVVLTGSTPVVYIYILPMLSILLMFGDKRSVMRMFIYAIGINAFSIMLQLNNVIDYYKDYDRLSSKITFWEIQFASLILTVWFVIKACDILTNREKYMDDLVEYAYTDPLTLLKNVRFRDEYKLTKSYVGDKDKFALSFIDIDNFKSFNTYYGHDVGDIVIHEVSKVLLSSTKNSAGTHAIRNGGDEFIIVSDNMEAEAFRKMNKSICSRIGKLKIYANDKVVGVTVSIGISTKKDDPECLEFADFYAKADERNQKAKDAGKNCTVG